MRGPCGIECMAGWYAGEAAGTIVFRILPIAALVAVPVWFAFKFWREHRLGSGR